MTREVAEVAWRGTEAACRGAGGDPCEVEVDRLGLAGGQRDQPHGLRGEELLVVGAVDPRAVGRDDLGRGRVREVGDEVAERVDPTLLEVLDTLDGEGRAT